VKIQGSVDEFQELMKRLRDVSAIMESEWKSYNARMRSRMRITASKMDHRMGRFADMHVCLSV